MLPPHYRIHVHFKIVGVKLATSSYCLSFVGDDSDGSGDCYSSTGFDVRGELPSQRYALGNPPWPGYTTAGGPNWVGFLSYAYSYIRPNTWFSNTMSHRSWAIIMLLLRRQSSMSERRCKTSFCPSPVENREQLHGRAKTLSLVYHDCGRSKYSDMGRYE